MSWPVDGCGRLASILTVEPSDLYSFERVALA